MRCRDTGELADRDVSYKAADGKYYSSEAAFLTLKTQQEWRDKCYGALADLCGYTETGTLFPPIFRKELKQFEPYGYEVVYMTIEDVADSITWATQNVSFRNDRNRALYVCAIIANNINKAILKKKREKKLAAKEVSLEAPEMELTQRSSHAKDLSSFID